MTRDRFGSFTGSKFVVKGILDFQTKQANRSFYVKLSYAGKILKNKDTPQKIIVKLKNFGYLEKTVKKLNNEKVFKNNHIIAVSVKDSGNFQTVFPIINFLLRIIF